jgi:hypothetical protein
LFIGQLPDNEALSSALTEYEGSFTETFAAGMAISEPQLQVRVRGVPEDYTTPRTRIVAIQNLLNQISNTTIGGVVFLRVKPTSTILATGQDDRLRWGFSQNFAVTIEGV